MLKASQIAILAVLAAAFEIVTALYIRWFPATFTDPLLGALAFAAAVPVGWLSVRLLQRAARLSPEQLLAGVCLVGALAMIADGVVLHWVPGLYGHDDTVLRFASAWLLWGYGVSIAIALSFASAIPKRQAA
jgi:hypothetical protein